MMKVLKVILKSLLAFSLVGLAAAFAPMVTTAWCFGCGVYIAYKLIDEDF